MRDARLQTLKGKFGAMVMEPGETLDQYAGRITAMSVRHSALGSWRWTRMGSQPMPDWLAA